MTVSFEGIEEGVGGRGFMKESGVFGGSMLGETFFHASTKAVSSAGDAAGRSVENGLPRRPAAARDRVRRREAERYIVLRFSTSQGFFGS